VRRPLAFPLLLLAATAWAQDAKVAFLTKQLATTRDPRVRAQTAVILGNTGSPAAVQPLCAALKDEESLVRSAAATALASVKRPEALACLNAALSDPNPEVQAALKRAIEASAAAPIPPLATAISEGALYISMDPVLDKIGGLPPEVTELASKLTREKLGSLGAAFAPAGETRAQASVAVKAKKLKGYLLKLNLLPSGGTGLKLEMLVLTYPEQALQGTWNVKAGGSTQYDKLLKVMVPRIVDDAATDLEWK
jgi:HEAT repeats